MDLLLEELLELLDLPVKKLDLILEERDLEVGEGGQLTGRPGVVLLHDAADGVLGAGALLNEAQTSAQEIAVAAELVRDHVGLRDQINPEELGQSQSIDRIGLHLGGGDRLELPRVSELEVDALGSKQVGDPVPAPRGLHHSAVRAWKGAKVAQDVVTASGELGSLHQGAVIIDRSDDQACLCRSMPC
jgi:hypothetical protein